jgi:hypothetical protein
VLLALAAAGGAAAWYANVVATESLRDEPVRARERVPDPVPDPGPAIEADAGPPAIDAGPERSEVVTALAARIDAGEPLAREELAPLYAFADGRPDDPAGHELLARAFVNLHWYRDALDRYESALRADPAAKDHPRVLADFVEMAQDEEVGDAAQDRIVEVWGAAALPAVQEAERSARWLKLVRIQRLRRRLAP